MPCEFYAFEMLTGQRLLALPIKTGKWAISTNADDSISCEMKSDSAEAKALDVWGSTPLARTGLLAVVDGMPVAAGPIWKRRYSQREKVISLTAGGLRSYWDRRVLVPVNARGLPLVDPATGDPVTAYDTNLSGISYGTIAKRYVELARLWPGGNIPMTLPPDEAAPAGTTRERNVAAIDLKKIRSLIDNLSNVESGPDIEFRPRWASNGLGIYWEMQTGTNAQPRLGQADPSLISWPVGASTGAAFDLEVNEDATEQATEVYAAGGRSADRVLIARGYNPTLDVAGYPLLQGVDTAHSDVKDQTTMQSYADQGAKLGASVASFWRMKVRAHEPNTPPLGDYWKGDMATLNIDPAEPVLGRGDRSYPVYRRIASISGDEKNESFDIAFAEALA